MARDPFDTRGGNPIGAVDLAARAAAAEARVDALCRAAARDLAIPDALRLDERTRRGVVARLEAVLASMEQGLSQALAIGAFPGMGSTLPLFHAAGLAADPALLAPLLAQVRLEQLAAALPHHAPRDPNRPSLLTRLAEHPAAAMAEAARALLFAESEARRPEAGRWQLPAHLHVRLLWWVASAMREQAGTLAGVAMDEALCIAVHREMAEAQERAGAQPAAVAAALVATIAPTARELPALLIEALQDRRMSLFLALIAHHAGIAHADARDLVLDPGAERLLLVLHALEIEREAIAQIAFLLCAADPTRDLPALADAIDALDTVDAAFGRDLLAWLRLDPDYRQARGAIAGRSSW